MTAVDGCGNDAECLVTYTWTVDVDDPIVTLNGPSTLNLCVGDTYTEQGATASDGCSGDVTGSIVITGGPVNTAAPGAYPLTYTAMDNCGNTGTAERTVTVHPLPTVTLNDPADVCETGADMNFTGTPTDANGVFTTTAGAGFTDNGDGTAVLDVSVAGPGTYDVTYTYTDVNGCSASQTVSVTVTTCAINFSGRIIWEADYLTTMTGVKDADVTLSGDDSDTDVSTVTGNYSLDATMGSNFEIKPLKNKPLPNSQNGLTAADASRIQQHVIGALPFTSPYKLIAADVNKTNSVTAQDANLISQALLGNPIAQAIFINTTWRFVPKSYIFPNPAAPWGFPEKIVLTGVSGSLTDQDFIGAKLGDVNNTANPANLIPVTPPNLIWKVQDQILEADAEIAVEFKTHNFDDLLALQFALQFDTGVLQFMAIETIAGSPMEMGNFGTYNVAGGDIRALLAMAQTMSLPDGTPAFRLKFKVLQGGNKLSEVLHLNDASLAGEAYKGDFTPGPVNLVFNGVLTGTNNPGAAKLILLQNRPNPFAGRTIIGFELPGACEATLRVFDMNGRLMRERTAFYPEGSHHVEFGFGNESASGVLYYELTTPFGVLAKKMVLSGE
ncbi:MAG: DUF5011 domain-containing protein [Haliscomenobacteraceae bacterium CHB4]|nr:DUF5011 domain-containing protein [Haliscomenobacteraceae bacterium CHB4]